MRWPPLAGPLVAAGLFLCDCSLNPHPLPPDDGTASPASDGGASRIGGNPPGGPGSSSGGFSGGAVEDASGLPTAVQTDSSAPMSPGVDGSVRSDGGASDAGAESDVTTHDVEAPDAPSDATVTLDAPVD